MRMCTLQKLVDCSGNQNRTGYGMDSNQQWCMNYSLNYYPHGAKTSGVVLGYYLYKYNHVQERGGNGNVSH